MSNSSGSTDGEFWSWIGLAVPGHLHSIADSDIERLDVAFGRLSYSSKSAVYLGFLRALKESYRIEVAELAALLVGKTIGSDSFSYFQRWLILQGREIFTIAVTAPDDIAQFIEDGESIPELDVGDMGILEVFEGRVPLFATIDIEESAWTWSDTSIDQIRCNLPKLWMKLGNEFKWDLGSRPNIDASIVVKCDINGIGTVRVGDKLRNKLKGWEAVVLSIQDPAKAFLILGRGDDYKAMYVVTEDLYELVA